MVAEAIERVRAYAEAGADGLFAPGLADITLIARLAEGSPLPLNIMVGDATPRLRALAEHGVARVSHRPRPYLVAMKALEQAARAGCERAWRRVPARHVFASPRPVCLTGSLTMSENGNSPGTALKDRRFARLIVDN